MYQVQWKGGKEGERKRGRKDGKEGSIYLIFSARFCSSGKSSFHLSANLQTYHPAESTFQKPFQHASSLPQLSSRSCNPILLEFIVYYSYACLLRSDNQSLGNPTLFPEAQKGKDECYARSCLIRIVFALCQCNPSINSRYLI